MFEYNGQLIDADTLQGWADEDGKSVEQYMSTYGISKVDNNSPSSKNTRRNFVFKGNEVDYNTVAQWAAEDNKTVDEYVSAYDLTELGKQTSQTPGAAANVTTAPDGESSSAPSLLESLSAQLGRGFLSAYKGVNNLAGMLTYNAVSAFNPDMTKEEKLGLYNAIKWSGTGAITSSSAMLDLAEEEISKSVKQYDDKSITEAISNKNYADAIEMTIGGALESAPSILLAFTGYGGLAIMGGTTAGNKFDEEFEKNPEESLLALTGNALGTGAIEASFDRVTMGLGKYLKLTGSSGLAKDAAKELAKEGAAAIFKKFGLATTGEGISEGLTTLSTKMYDMITLEDRELTMQDLPEIIDSAIIGSFTGGTLATVSQIGNNKTAGRERAEYILSSPEYKNAMKKSADKINELVEAYKSEPTKEGKDLIQNQIDEIQTKATEAKRQNSINLYSLEGDNLKNYAANVDEINSASKVINSEKSSKEAKQLATDKLNDLSNKNVELIKKARDAKFKSNLEKARKLAEEQGISFKAMNTDEMAEYELSKDRRKTKQARKIAETTEGYIAQNADGTQEIVINTDNASKLGNITVGSHELLHGVLYKTLMSNPKTGENIGQALKNILIDKQSGKLQGSELVKRLSLYENESKSVQGEELVTLTSDAILKGDLQFDEGLFTKLGDGIRRVLQDAGFKKIKFNNAKDVYNFVKDYNRDIEKGGISKAMKRAADEGITGKLVSKKITAEQEEQIKKSMTPEKKATLMNKYKAGMEGIERTSYTKNNPLPPRLEGELVQEFQGYISKLVSSKFRQLEEEAITREDAEMTLLGEALNAIRTFNPNSNDDIAGYVAMILARRQSMIFDQVNKEFTDDVETAKGVIAEDTDIEVSKKEIEQRKKENLSDSMDTTVEVEGVAISEHVTKAVSKNARLAVKKLGDQISSNRTVTPFVQSLKEELAEDLRKTVKAFINNSEGGFEGFLQKNKEAILNNFTTTYLSKHPLFKKGIQKSSGGEMSTDNQGNKFFKPKWLSPTWTGKAWDWVDDKGKKLKIDRDNAGARGLTSGPEFIRRNPKINEVLTENEFIDYHFQDGAQRKKKKQNPEDALARQIASEYGFEILKNDLNNQGEIYQALSETADLFDIILAETEMQKIAKDIDRGTVKFSKSIPDANFSSAMDAVETLSKSLLQIADGNPDLAEVIADNRWIKSFPVTFEKIILPGLSKAVANTNSKTGKIEVIREFLKIYSRPIRTASYNKSLPIYLTRNSLLLRAVRNSLVESDKKLIAPKGGNAPIRVIKENNRSFVEINGERFKSVELDITNNSVKQDLVDGKLSKDALINQSVDNMDLLKSLIFSTGKENPGLALTTIKLAQKDNRAFFRMAAKPNAIVQNYKGDLIYEHNPPSQYVYEEIEKFLKNKSSSNEASLRNLLNSWEANIVPKDFAKIVDSDAEAKAGVKKEGKRYDKALRETNYTFDSPVFKFSKSDVSRIDAMVSEKSGISSEIGEVLASKLGKKKGKWKFFIPPSADDFMGLMYYMVGKGQQGDADIKFIKEKLVDPFAEGIASLEHYKQQKLQEFKRFKKLVRVDGKIKLEKESPTGFTNEQAVRIYLWTKKGNDVKGITEAERKAVMKYVNDTPALLEYSKHIQNLFAADGGYPDVQDNWLAGTMTIDILEHINEKARAEFLSEWINNTEELLGKFNNKGEISGPIANKLRAAFGNNYMEALSDVVYRMKHGRAREFGKNRLANQFNNWIANSVGAIMFLNRRSALLQQISLVNFINYSDNNPIAFAKALGNREQYSKDWVYLFNSDFLKQRRSGLQIDVNEDEIAKAAEQGGNSVKNILAVILKKGFVFTTFADSFAIASGGATFYRNRINTYMKQGMSVEDAEAKAFIEFKELTEESQQSSRPDRVSQQQAGSLGRLILAFANTPMQYSRLTKKAAQDLINRRGNWKQNLGKLLYYGAVQNIIFTGLQQALFSLMFDDEDDEIQDMKKISFAANSMVDGFLRGLGFGGAVASVAKNMVMEAIEQSQGRKDYDEVVWEALKLSPPLGSKISKARSVARTFTWKQEREKVFNKGLSLDNPIFMAAGQTVSALTNLPLDRVVRDVDMISTPLRQETEWWQNLAIAFGYGKYELGLLPKAKKKKSNKDGKRGKAKRGVIR